MTGTLLSSQEQPHGWLLPLFSLLAVPKAWKWRLASCATNNAMRPQLASLSIWCPISHPRPDSGWLKPVQAVLTSQAAKKMQETPSKQPKLASSFPPTIITTCVHKRWTLTHLQRNFLNYPLPALPSDEIASSTNTACYLSSTGKQQQVVNFCRIPSGSQPKTIKVPTIFIKGMPTTCRGISSKQWQET